MNAQPAPEAKAVPRAGMLHIEMGADDAKALLRSWYGGEREGDYFKAERAARTIEDAVGRHAG